MSAHVEPLTYLHVPQAAVVQVRSRAGDVGALAVPLAQASSEEQATPSPSWQPPAPLHPTSPQVFARVIAAGSDEPVTVAAAVRVVAARVAVALDANQGLRRHAGAPQSQRSLAALFVCGATCSSLEQRDASIVRVTAMTCRAVALVTAARGAGGSVPVTEVGGAGAGARLAEPEIAADLGAGELSVGTARRLAALRAGS